MTEPRLIARSIDPVALVREIRRYGRELGFQQVAIADLELGRHRDYLDQWLADGFAGEMSWMERHRLLRQWPERLQPGARTAICVRMDYLPESLPAAQALEQPHTAYISRYALGRDYHKLIRKRLADLARRVERLAGGAHRAFVDSAPVLERALAQRSGLGWIGKNTMLLNRDAGSWFFLGEIYTDLELPPDTPASEHCGSCTACLDACPTGAFAGAYRLDARRCISYLTIELQGSIPEGLRPLMGNRVFGCDDCQLICPFNRFAQITVEDDFRPRHGLDNRTLLDLFNWSEAEYLQYTEGSAIRRIGYQRWLRNLAVGLGNAPRDPAIVTALRRRLEDAAPMVREHVAWALAQQDARRGAT